MGENHQPTNKTPEEIMAVRKNLRHHALRDVMLDELAKSCPGMSYDKLMQAALSLQKSKDLESFLPDTEYNEMGRQFKQRLGQRTEQTRMTIQETVREQRLSGQLNFTWYYEQPITEWYRDLAYIKQLSDYLLSGKVPTRGSAKERSYEIFQDELVLEENPQLLDHVGILAEQLNIVVQPDPLMLAVQSVRKLPGTKFRHLIAESKEVYYCLYNVLNKTGFKTVIYGAGLKITGNLFQLPYQIGCEWYKHRIWYFGNLDYQGINIWYELKNNAPLDMEIKLATDFYKAFLLYNPLKKEKSKLTPENQFKNQEALTAFCQEFSPEVAELWRETLDKNMYYPQSMLGTQELQKLFRELDKNDN